MKEDCNTFYFHEGTKQINIGIRRCIAYYSMLLSSGFNIVEYCIYINYCRDEIIPIELQSLFHCINIACIQSCWRWRFGSSSQFSTPSQTIFQWQILSIKFFIFLVKEHMNRIIYFIINYYYISKKKCQNIIYLYPNP